MTILSKKMDKKVEYNPAETSWRAILTVRDKASIALTVYYISIWKKASNALA